MARSWLRVLTAGLTVAPIGCVALPSPATQPAQPVVPPVVTSAVAAQPQAGSSFAEAVVQTSGQAPATAPVPTTTMPAPGPAVAAHPLTLDELEQLAQAHNPILRRDQARIDSARGQALQASQYPNPRFDTGNPETFGGRNNSFNVGLSQEVVVKGKLRLDTAAAEEAVRQAELSYNENRFALLANVRGQYYSVLSARRRRDVLIELDGIVKSAAETGRKLEKAQETSKIDTLLLVVDAQQVNARLRQAEVSLATEQKQLAAVVGVAAVEKAEVAGDLATRRPEFDEELVRRYSATGSTLVKTAQAEIARRRLLLRRAEVEPYPNVTLGTSYQFGLIPGSEQFGLTISFPIPAWDRNQGNIRSAVANIRDAEMSLRVLQNDQLNKVADTLGRYISGRQLVERYETDILPNVRQAQKLSQEGYAKGVFDFARYLQAQRTVVESNLSYVDALEALWSAAADVAGLLQLERMP